MPKRHTLGGFTQALPGLMRRAGVEWVYLSMFEFDVPFYPSRQAGRREVLHFGGHNRTHAPVLNLGCPTQEP